MLYALIVGIWALVLLPMWLRGKESTSNIKQVDSFRMAMAQLSDENSAFAKGAPKHTVTANRAVRAGRIDPARARKIALRRKVFLGVVATFPLVFALIAIAHVSVVSILFPFFAVGGYVAWVRNDIAQSRSKRTRTTRAERGVPTHSARTHFLAQLSHLRAVAAEKLAQTQQEVETEQTQSWQPEVEETETLFSMPEPVLPTYVNAPTATEVPRNIDREHGQWDGTAMVAAVERQRKANLAELVADLVENEPPMPVASDIDDTTELQRVMGA